MLIAVDLDGEPRYLELKRDSRPASLDDVRFVVTAHNLLGKLLAAAGGERDALTRDELALLGGLASLASSGPWQPFLEGEGGIGGCSVIWVSDDDEAPDMYVWMDDEIAPDIYFDFIANLRQDIPELLRVVAG
jgi:hypothetical protein